MLHSFVFTIHLALLHVFNVKVKNLAFLHIKSYYKCMVFYEELSLLMTKHRHRIEINTVNHCNSIILPTYTY